MPEDSSNSRFEQALIELHEYLSDLIPPLVVSDSIELLLTYPPAPVAATINSWATGQYRSSTSLPRSDYLFHALKKIHMIGEYKLVPRKELGEFLEKLKPHVLNYCPPAERELLILSLERMDETVESTSSPVEVVYRQTAGEAKPGAVPDVPAFQSEVNRIGEMLQRITKDLESMVRAGEAIPEEKQEEVLSRVLAQTARSARASIELEEALEHIRRMGIQAGTEDVFRALGRNLPEWSLAPRPDLSLPEDSNLKAMHRIVTDTNDSKEAASRFHQMVRAAIERLNEGHLQAAVNVIELAEKIVEAKEVDQTVIENLRRRGHEDVDLDHLKKYAESAELQPSLKKILSFFDALNPGGLMELLRTETKRDRRRLLLSLLECHGESTRKAAIAELRGAFSPDFGVQETYFRRNLLHLIRRIPAGHSENQDELLRILSQHTDLNFPVIVVKETITCLGQVKHKDAEEILGVLLAETESRLNASKSVDESQRYIALLDRIASSLARLGTTGARKLLLDHALSRKPKWGNTIGRLSELAGQDLSSDPMAIHRLLSALHSYLPRKVLGFVVQNRDQDLKNVVEALAGTSTPEVREALENIRLRFPESAAAQAAAAKPGGIRESSPKPSEQKAPVAAASSLTGDLDLFGLPGLFQSLSDHGLTGSLTLKDPNGPVFATAEFSNGKLISAQAGNLSGETAVFQLLEHPRPGTFQFVRNPVKEEGPAKDVIPILMEGIRRYDELAQLKAILPDHVRIISRDVKPSPLAEEKDGLLFRDLWNATRIGATPEQCETRVASDSYRIRRLLVHWYETGVITIL